MEEKMMNEEIMMNENETTEVAPVIDTVEESSSGSMLFKLAIIGVCGAVAGAAAFGAKKLKQRNRQRTIEKPREEGWTVEEPAEDAEYVDVDVDFFDEPEETQKEEENK